MSFDSYTEHEIRMCDDLKREIVDRIKSKGFTEAYILGKLNISSEAWQDAQERRWDIALAIKIALALGIKVKFRVK